MTPGLTWSVVDLRLKHVFTISRGSRRVVPTVIVRYSRDGLTGFGEASPLARYGDTVGSVIRFLENPGRELTGGPAPGEEFPGPERIGVLLEAAGPGNAPAKAAIDVAIHDWTGKRLRTPLWKYFGLDPALVPRSSMTIGIDSPDVVERKVREAEAFGSLKIKMGVPGDRELVTAVRKLTTKPLRVDANEGWKSKEEALRHVEWLADKGVELIEQPLPAGNHRDVAWLRERTRIPLYADEDLRGAEDLPAAARAYDGINVKLMKCGGIGGAKQIIGIARSLGLRVMIGCMIESSVGISAAAQLSPLADVVDLDGCLLVENDPFRGVVAPDGTILLGDRPGIGLEPEEAP